MDLTRLREDVETFAAALSREEYLTRAGLKDESAAASIRERFAALGSRGLFEEARDEAERTADPDRRRSLRAVAEFLGGNCLEHSPRTLADRLTTAEATQLLDVDGERIPLRAADVRVRNEPIRGRRAAVDAARLRTMEQLNG